MSATILNTKIIEIENKVPDITGLVTTVSFKTKMVKLRIKFLVLVAQLKNQITILKYQASTKHISHICDILDSNIKEKLLVIKTNISSLVKHSDLKTRLTKLATKLELKTEQGKTEKLLRNDFK